jgi:hypothetical protein
VTINFVADLGDPRILRRLADPDVLANPPECDDGKPGFDEVENIERWKTLGEMPLGILTEEKAQSQRVRAEARQKAEKERELRAKGLAPQPNRASAAPHLAPGR